MSKIYSEITENDDDANILEEHDSPQSIQNSRSTRSFLELSKNKNDDDYSSTSSDDDEGNPYNFQTINGSDNPLHSSNQKLFKAHQIDVTELILNEACAFKETLHELNILGPAKDELYYGKLNEDEGVFTDYSLKDRAISILTYFPNKISNVFNYMFGSAIQGGLSTNDVMFHFDEQLHEAQSKFHRCKNFLHYYVLEGNVTVLDKVLNKLPVYERRIEVGRPDPCGVNSIHLAFLHKKYETGRYLVERFPDVALLPVSQYGCGVKFVEKNKRKILKFVKDAVKFMKGEEISSNSVLIGDYAEEIERVINNFANDEHKNDEVHLSTNKISHNSDSIADQQVPKRKSITLKQMGRSQTASVAAIHEHEIRKYRQNAKEKGADSLFSIMPYTGQNILHISIIHRNSEQVRWILDFFRSREHAIPGAPVKLLVQRTIGRFFRKEGDFYFGETPLFFAASANNKAVFDIVLSYATTITRPMVHNFLRNVISDWQYLNDTFQESAWFHNLVAKKLGYDPYEGGITRKEFLLYLNRDKDDSKLLDVYTDEKRRLYEMKFVEQKSKWKRELMSQLGPQALFARNRHGHNLLHLTVIHGLSAMFEHISNLGYEALHREIGSSHYETSRFPKQHGINMMNGSINNTRDLVLNAERRKSETMYFDDDNFVDITYLKLEREEPWTGWSFRYHRSETEKTIIEGRIENNGKMNHHENNLNFSSGDINNPYGPSHLPSYAAGSPMSRGETHPAAFNQEESKRFEERYATPQPGSSSHSGRHISGRYGNVALNYASGKTSKGNSSIGSASLSKRIKHLSDEARDMNARYDFVFVDKKNPAWKTKAVERLMDSRLFKAIDESMHSPLTLAAARKSPLMLRTIIDYCRKPRNDYGPIRSWLIDLDGLEVEFEKRRFWNRNFGAKSNYRMKKSKIDFNAFSSAIQWLCRSDQVDDDGREENIDELANIEAVRTLIESKWTRTMAQQFAKMRLLAFVTLICCSLLLLFSDSVPKIKGRSWKGIFTSDNFFVLFLYLLILLIIAYQLIGELPLLIQEGISYLTGGKSARGWALGSRYLLLIMSSAFIGLITVRGYISVGNEAPSQAAVDATSILMGIVCAASWFWLFYYAVGDKGTGPTLLVMYHVVSRDLTAFLPPFLILLFAFAFMLTVILRSEDEFCTKDELVDGLCEMTPSKWPASFVFFIGQLLSLIRESVGIEDPEGDHCEDPEDDHCDDAILEGKSHLVKWIYKFIHIVHAALIILMLLNLFIAMVTYTYDEYKQRSDALLLLEKYNIMNAYESRMIKYDEIYATLKKLNTALSRSIEVNIAGDRVVRWYPFVFYILRFISETLISIMEFFGSYGHFLRDHREDYAIVGQGVLFEITEKSEEWWHGDTMAVALRDTKMKKNTTLLLIDPQNDFHTGSLKVPGSIQNAENIIKMLRGNKNSSDISNREGDDGYSYDMVDEVIVTLDSHYVNDVGHASFWQDKNGKPPNEFQVISNDDIRNGVWRPRNRKLTGWVLYYTSQLEKYRNDTVGEDAIESKKVMCTIWPTHCLVGSEGFAVHPPIHEALMAWERKRGKVCKYQMKGTSRLTEMYSALVADVVIPTNSLELAMAFGVVGEKFFQCEYHRLQDVANHDTPDDEYWSARAFLNRQENWQGKGRCRHCENTVRRMDSQLVWRCLIRGGYLNDTDTCIGEESLGSTSINLPLIKDLILSDHLLVAGQARSHCVNYTIRTLMNYWQKDNSCITILEDCTSSVTKFEKWGQEFFEHMNNLGVTIDKTDNVLKTVKHPEILSMVPDAWSFTSVNNSDDRNNGECKHGSISGKNFRLGDTQVLFGDKECEILAITPTIITYSIPPFDMTKKDETRFGQVKVSVVCCRRRSNEVIFHYSDEDSEMQNVVN